MKKILINSIILPVFFAVVIMATGCEEDPLPLTETISSGNYLGEWAGATITTRALTAGTISETTVPLAEIMSLRQENGVDTFNFKDPITGNNIAGRQGTWYVTQINDSEDPALNGAKILRLRVVASATRIIYTTLTIKQLESKQLVLNDGANKTLVYLK